MLFFHISHFHCDFFPLRIFFQGINAKVLIFVLIPFTIVMWLSVYFKLWTHLLHATLLKHRLCKMLGRVRGYPIFSLWRYESYYFFLLETMVFCCKGRDQRVRIYDCKRVYLSYLCPSEYLYLLYEFSSGICTHFRQWILTLTRIFERKLKLLKFWPNLRRKLRLLGKFIFFVE